MKYFILVVFLILRLNANNSLWDSALDSANDLWDKTKEVSKDTWKKTKEYSNKGKNIVLEQSIKNSLNLSLDTKYLNVKDVKISNSGKIVIVMYLNGEDTDLLINLNNFDWGVTKDEKYIIFENLDFSLNIPWLEHIFKYYITTHNGYLKVPYSISTKGILASFKSSINTTFNINKSPTSQDWKIKKDSLYEIWKITNKHDITKMVAIIYKDDIIQVDKFILNGSGVEMILHLKGSRDIFKMSISNYDWATANKKSLIVFKNITIKTCTKPWIESIIKHQKNELVFTYTDIMYKILKKN
jgi:hypothetical protein